MDVRELPAFETAEYGPKRHRHALVIPVINEGERIRGQLQRIQAAKLPVDVVIADGGSTDGSLEAAFVRRAGVRAHRRAALVEARRRCAELPEERAVEEVARGHRSA